MLDDDKRQEQNRAGVRKWYGENRTTYNQLRRARYAENKEARAKARERAANYRNKKTAITREIFRDLDGQKVRVFSTGEVAAKMNRTPQMIRNWQKQGLIPETSFPDTHRFYTSAQMDLLVLLDSAIKDSGGSWSAPAVVEALNKLQASW
jgi:hypothetical protein